MPSINTQKYATYLATQFANSANTNALYLGIGRPLPWDVVGSPDDPTADTQSVDFVYWRDLLGAKRINGNTDVSLVVTRHDWETGTTYRQYDDTDPALFTDANSTFYVVDQIASDAYYYVYKCLWNNNGGPSTVSPATGVGGNTEPIALTDGYVWQYMYRIEPDQSKFLTPQWMPVYANTSISTNANTYAGRLPTQVPLVIESAGSGYDPSTLSTIDVEIDGDGHNAAITLVTTNFTANTLTSLALTSGGIGYTTVNGVSITQTGVSNTAEVRAIIPPYPNHGYDPVQEFGASAVMFATEFRDTESDELTTGNDYRRIVVIANPLNANGTNANGSYYRMTYDVELQTTSNTADPAFAPDDEVTVTSTLYSLSGTDIAVTYPVKARVVDVTDVSGRKFIRLTAVNDKGRTGITANLTSNTANSVTQSAFMSGDTLTSTTSGTKSAVIASNVDSLSVPELQLFSGDVLYVHHHTTITRSPSQVEQIKLVFQFGS